MRRGGASADKSAKQQDLVHLVLGVVMVVMAVFAFINPAENMVLFPLIFFCAALLQLSNAVFAKRRAQQGAGLQAQWLLPLLAGIFLLVLTVVSAINIW